MSEQECQPTANTIDMEQEPSQPPAAANLARNATEDGTEAPSPAPGLLIFGAGSEALCTDDGCFVTFEKG